MRFIEFQGNLLLIRFRLFLSILRTVNDCGSVCISSARSLFFLSSSFPFHVSPHQHSSSLFSLHDSSLLRDNVTSITRLSSRSLRNFVSCTCFFSLSLFFFSASTFYTHIKTDVHIHQNIGRSQLLHICMSRSYLYAFNHMNDSEGIKNILIHLNSSNRLCCKCKSALKYISLFFPTDPITFLQLLSSLFDMCVCVCVFSSCCKK